MKGDGSLGGIILGANGNNLTHKTNTTQKLYLDRWMDGGTGNNNIVAVDFKGRLSYS